MPLVTPRVIGPLSECSSSIRVQGQITGAAVMAFANGRLVAQGTATWSDQVFPLREQLRLDDHVSAAQEWGGDSSDGSPEPAEEVQRGPTSTSEVGPVGFASHFYECGRCVAVTGAIPGATVEVFESGSLRGSGDAPDSTGRLGLDPATGLGERLEARQVACGIHGPTVPGPLPDALPPVVYPTVFQPLRACQRAVLVGNVYEGGEVTLERAGNPLGPVCFDVSSQWWAPLDPPLMEGERISAWQEFQRCDVRSAPTPWVPVEAPGDVPVPKVEAPLCAGSPSVRVIGLLPGSRVQILLDGEPIRLGEAPSVVFDFPVPPLPADAWITAQQELCDVWSLPSRGVRVDRVPAMIPPTTIVGPLFECGRVVSVRNVYPGAELVVYSAARGDRPISRRHFSFGTEAVIPVSPYLIAHDEVYVVQRACGMRRVESAREPVQRVGQLLPPRVEDPLRTGTQVVAVLDAVPGALVEVYVNWVWRGGALAGPPPTRVPISGQLGTHSTVQARQTLCDATELGPGVIVTVPPPRTPVDLAPSHGATEIGRRPTFTWRDPGALSDERATSFNVEVFRGLSLVASMAGHTSTTFVLTSDLAEGANHNWRVRANNASGSSSWAEASFTTAMPPSTPPTRTGYSRVVTYNCHSERHTYSIWSRDATAGTGWRRLGQLAAQYDSSGHSCPAVGSTPFTVTLEDGHTYEIAIVDPAGFVCGGQDDPTLPECERTRGTFVGSSSGPPYERII